MEDNFALHYVLKHPGVNSRAGLVPLPRASLSSGVFHIKPSSLISHYGKHSSRVVSANPQLFCNSEINFENVEIG
jgi:hypothetical protein